MAKPTLPDDETLVALLATHTRQDIAAMYGVTPAAVSNRIRRRNLPTPGRGNLPWTLAPQDRDDTIAQYLRALRRHHQGTARPHDRSVKAARTWAQNLLDTHRAVSYDLRTGFHYVDHADVEAHPTPCVQPQP